MPLTVIGLRGLIARRVGPYAPLADLDEALTYSLRESAVEPADPLTPADADLAQLDATLINQLIDVAYVRALESIVNNCEETEFKRHAIKGDPDAVRRGLEKRLEHAVSWINQKYQISYSPIVPGVVNMQDTEITPPLGTMPWPYY